MLLTILFLLAPLAVVPLGFRVAGTPGRLAGNLQPWAAALAVVSFYFPPGPVAALLVAPWLAVTVLAGLSGLSRLVRNRFRSATEACFGAGLLYLPVGGGWLVLSRWGAKPLGFEEPIVLLTAIHFHYSGFALPILTGAAGRLLRGNWFRLAAVGAIAGTPLLAAGIAAFPTLEVIAAFLLVATAVLLSILVITIVPRVRRMGTRFLLAVSAGSVVLALLFAGVYATGEFLGHRFISIPQMAWMHGVTNAVGFALCGLIGWSLESKGEPS